MVITKINELWKKENFIYVLNILKLGLQFLNKDFKSEKFSTLVQFSIRKCIYFYVYMIIYFQDDMIINSNKV